MTPRILLAATALAISTPSLAADWAEKVVTDPMTDSIRIGNRLMADDGKGLLEVNCSTETHAFTVVVNFQEWIGTVTSGPGNAGDVQFRFDGDPVVLSAPWQYDTGHRIMNGHKKAAAFVSMLQTKSRVLVRAYEHGQLNAPTLSFTVGETKERFAHLREACGITGK